MSFHYSIKKIIFLLIIIVSFIPTVKADFTKDQADDIALFSSKFVIEGNKRTDSKGYSLLAYMQGQARIDGYQSKLYKVDYDYNHKNYIDAYKWTFDASSYISFVYYQTFGLILTQSNTDEKDSYNGLFINKFTGNPYTINSFNDDALHNQHFYYVKRNVIISELNFNELKKGDLITIENQHIMIYIGDEKIAHASKNAIIDLNLGLEVANLKEKYLHEKVNIIRIKDNIIPETKKANMQITWPDTAEIIDFSKNKTDNFPRISYIKSSNDWSKEVIIDFTLTALEGLDSYSFKDDTWINIEGNTFKLTETVNKNGEYILKLKDKKGNLVTKKVEISNIDENVPIVKSISTISKDNYSILAIDAIDEESGLALEPYSFDECQTWITKNTYEVTEEKNYTICVKDQVGNIYSDKIFVKIKSKNSPKFNNLILGNSFQNKRKLTITVLNCDKCRLIIKNSNYHLNDSDKWNEINGSYTTYLEEGNYKIWLQDNNQSIVEIKQITINIDENYNRNYIVVFLIFLMLIGILSFCYIRNKNNKI